MFKIIVIIIMIISIILITNADFITSLVSTSTIHILITM